MSLLNLAAIQMVSGIELSANLTAMQKLVRAAAEQGANLVLLPEYWPIMGKRDTDKLAIAEEFGDGLLQNSLSELAQELKITLIGGTIPLKSDRATHVFNSMLTFNECGECVGRYDKMHLFGFSGLGERYLEADTIIAGETIAQLNLSGLSIAQGVCYDLRFPEFFRAQLPFDLLLLPAAFTYTTGQAHWEILLQARAIENQCYVLASAQGGYHDNGRRTFGHSMLIDPWGVIVERLPEGEGVIIGVMDTNKVQSVRNHLPALYHQKIEVQKSE